LVKEIKKKKKLNDKKLEDNRRQAAQKRSIEYPDQLKQVENNNKWKEFTNLKPGTKMNYKGRQYGEQDKHKLMKAIIAQMKRYTCNCNKLPGSSQKAPRELPESSQRALSLQVNYSSLELVVNMFCK
jgi:hypothetical protein